MVTRLLAGMSAASRKTLLIAFVGTSAYAATATQQEVDQGWELYNDFGCYQCHGHFGQGASTGPPLAPEPYPYGAFEVFVRTPVARMPPYSENVLSDNELQKIHHYLQSIENGPTAEEIPLLNTEN